jgi:ankyrin repeat protein
MYAAEFAAKGGSIEALKLLLSKGAKINIKDSEGETALSLAAGNPYNDLMNIEAVRLLIAKGVLLDKETFIRMAAKGYNNEVKLFLEKGIDINAQDKRIKRTALMEAAWRGQVETVKLLLNNKKIDVNISDQRGDTARSLAKSQHHLEIIKMLSSREEKNN